MVLLPELPEDAAGPSTLKRKSTPPDLVEIAQKKHGFNDTSYLEQSREINDSVRNAVTAGELQCGPVVGAGSSVTG